LAARARDRRDVINDAITGHRRCMEWMLCAHARRLKVAKFVRDFRNDLFFIFVQTFLGSE